MVVTLCRPFRARFPLAPIPRAPGPGLIASVTVTSAITHAYYMLETDHSIMSLLHRRFATPDLKPRRGATYQPRAEAAKRPKPWVGITEIEALKGRHNMSP